jgi:uncharacterized membrane protein
MVNNLLLGICLVIFSTIVGAVGAVMFKLASKRLEKGFFVFLRNIRLYLGIVFYGISALIFVYALRFGDLSALYPVAALSYVWISLLSIKYLHEKMNTYKWLGISFIIVGVIFIGFGA